MIFEEAGPAVLPCCSSDWALRTSAARSCSVVGALSSCRCLSSICASRSSFIFLIATLALNWSPALLRLSRCSRWFAMRLLACSSCAVGHAAILLSLRVGSPYIHYDVPQPDICGSRYSRRYSPHCFEKCAGRICVLGFSTS
jgi:hypothetical protein